VSERGLLEHIAAFAVVVLLNNRGLDRDKDGIACEKA
jgi:hypothetical protein